MPNEPTLPTDFLATLAGLGRNLTQRLPDRDVFPLNPQAPKTFSPRDVGELFLPQSQLDVLLGGVPGGKIGKPVAKKAAKTLTQKSIPNAIRELSRSRNTFVEAQLVPALRSLETGKEYVGQLGRDLWHEKVAKKFGLDISKHEPGFINSETGQWLTPFEANQQNKMQRTYDRVMAGQTRRLEAQWRAANKGKEAAKAAPKVPTWDDMAKQFPGLPKGKDPVVPALMDKKTGEWFAGIPGVDWMHGQVLINHPELTGSTVAGFKNIRTGKFFKESTDQPGIKYWRVPTEDVMDIVSRRRNVKAATEAKREAMAETRKAKVKEYLKTMEPGAERDRLVAKLAALSPTSLTTTRGPNPR